MGFPIRRSPDHRLLGNSPELIAANHVLHSSLAPRHSPCALRSLCFVRLCGSKPEKTAPSLRLIQCSLGASPFSLIPSDAVPVTFAAPRNCGVTSARTQRMCRMLWWLLSSANYAIGDSDARPKQHLMRRCFSCDVVFKERARRLITDFPG